MVTLQTDDGILVTFDTVVSCPSTYGLKNGYSGDDCGIYNCDRCWEKAIEQIEDISVVIQFKKNR